jgi:HlyD family secretion protein
MKRVIIVFAVLAVALSGVLAYRLRAQRADAERRPGSSGVLEGTTLTVSARLAGRLTKVLVHEGQAVKAGDLLAELDCAEPDAGVAAAEAQVGAARAQVAALSVQAEAAALQAEAARRQVTAQAAQIGSLRVQQRNAVRQTARAETLKQSDAMPDAQVETYQTAVADLGERVHAANASVQAGQAGADAAARQAGAVEAGVAAAEQQTAVAVAGLARARAIQAECRLLAPSAGVVTLRAREPGEVVLPGSAVVELTDDRILTARFYVANADLGAVSPGGKVEVAADAFPGESFGGIVLRVARVAEFTPRTVQTRSDRERLVYAVDAEVANPAGRLRAGMPIEVALARRAP